MRVIVIVIVSLFVLGCRAWRWRRRTSASSSLPPQKSAALPISSRQIDESISEYLLLYTPTAAAFLCRLLSLTPPRGRGLSMSSRLCDGPRQSKYWGHLRMLVPPPPPHPAPGTLSSAHQRRWTNTPSIFTITFCCALLLSAELIQAREADDRSRFLYADDTRAAVILEYQLHNAPTTDFLIEGQLGVEYDEEHHIRPYFLNLDNGRRVVQYYSPWCG